MFNSGLENSSKGGSGRAIQVYVVTMVGVVVKIVFLALIVVSLRNWLPGRRLTYRY